MPPSDLPPSARLYTVKVIAAVVLVLGAIGSLLFALHEKTDAAIVLPLATAAGAALSAVVSWLVKGKIDKSGPAMVFVVGAAGAVVACSPAANQQAAGVGGEACKLITAFGGTSEEQSLCAFAADVIAIEEGIRAQRADAGPGARKAASCQIVGTVCATDPELGAAIRARKAAR